jgi:hypothetical protein
VTDELHEAQAALELAREREAARREASQLPTLGEVIAAALPIPQPGRYRCNTRCGAALDLPGVCEECARREAARAVEVRVRAWLRTVPERQRDVSWAELPKLRSDTGRGRIRLRPGDTLGGIRAQLAEVQRGAIIGAAGSGKTTLAVAWLRGELERDPGARVRFVSSADLLRPEVGEEGGPHPLALALSADVLVLDDLGAELEGAQRGSGLLAQRVGPASRVVAERYERGRRTVVTTGFEPTEIAGLYGDRVARRVFEAAAVVRLGGG